jgi:hypothetical protein
MVPQIHRSSRARRATLHTLHCEILRKVVEFFEIFGHLGEQVQGRDDPWQLAGQEECPMRWSGMRTRCEG